MGGENVFDFLWVNVFPASDDHVREPAHYSTVAVRLEYELVPEKDIGQSIGLNVKSLVRRVEYILITPYFSRYLPSS